MVEGLLPGEKAFVRLQYQKKNYFIASLISISKISINRISPICPVFEMCGGCTLQHINYQIHKSIKSKKTAADLTKIAKINQDIEINYHDPNKFLNYRNKSIFPVCPDSISKVKLGYYRRQTNEIIDIESCPILTNQINYIFKHVRFLLQSLSTKELDNIKHVSIRESEFNKEIILVLISKHKLPNRVNKLLIDLYSKYSSIVGILNNIQPLNNNVIFGDLTTNICGSNYIKEKFLNLTFRIGATSFFQINLYEAQKAVSLIINNVLTYSDINRVIDAYSGIGTIALPIASHNINVVGIEVNSESYSLAEANSTINNINCASFILSSVEASLELLLDHNDYLILDPPRKGLDRSIIDIIINKKPKYIAYLSCNTSTLARDLSYLMVGKVYQIDTIHNLDFFPQTMHVECLVFLKLFISPNFRRN